jgi:hypothetical protein
MHKSATKCNETLGKWCKNKHEASKIIDTLETYQLPRDRVALGVAAFLFLLFSPASASAFITSTSVLFGRPLTKEGEGELSWPWPLRSCPSWLSLRCLASVDSDLVGCVRGVRGERDFWFHFGGSQGHRHRREGGKASERGLNYTLLRPLQYIYELASFWGPSLMVFTLTV